MPTRAEFVATVYAAARNIGLSDVAARTAAAQAANETGFGRAAPGNNFFGIKAGSSWTGPVVNFNTHEEVNGALVAQRDAFRAYDSPEASLRDWAALMARSYPDVLTATTIGAAADALMNGVNGRKYATDSQYKSKLLSINGSFGDAAAQAYVGAPTPATASPATDLARLNAPVSEAGRTDLNAGAAVDRIGSAPSFASLQSAFGRADPVGMAPGFASLQHMMQAIPVPATMSPDLAASRGLDSALSLNFPAAPVPPPPSVSDGKVRAGDLPSIPGPLADWPATRFNPAPTAEQVLPMTIRQAAEAFTPMGVDPQAVINKLVAVTKSTPDTVINNLGFLEKIGLKSALDGMGAEYQATGTINLPPAPRQLSADLANLRNQTPATDFAPQRGIDPIGNAPSYASLQAAFPSLPPTPSASQAVADPVGGAPSFSDLQSTFNPLPTSDKARSVVDATFANLGNPAISVAGSPDAIVNQTFAALGMPSLPQVSPLPSVPSFPDAVSQTFANLSDASKGSLAGLDLAKLAPSISTSLENNPNVIQANLPPVPSAPTPATMDGVTAAIRNMPQAPAPVSAPTPATMDGVTQAIRNMPTMQSSIHIGQSPMSMPSPGQMSNLAPTVSPAVTSQADRAAATIAWAPTSAPSFSTLTMASGGSDARLGSGSIPGLPGTVQTPQQAAAQVGGTTPVPALPALPMTAIPTSALSNPAYAGGGGYSGGIGYTTTASGRAVPVGVPIKSTNGYTYVYNSNGSVTNIKTGVTRGGDVALGYGGGNALGNYGGGGAGYQ